MQRFLDFPLHFSPPEVIPRRARAGLHSLQRASRSPLPKSALTATLPNVLRALRCRGPTQGARISRLSVQVQTRTLGRGVVARRAANACVPGSPRRLLCRLWAPVSGGSPMAGSLELSLSVCVCLCLGLSVSLPTMAQREGNLPWPLHLPTPAPTRSPWSTAEAAAARSASRLRSPCVFLP